jgi:hypothetical protein
VAGDPLPPPAAAPEQKAAEPATPAPGPTPVAPAAETVVPAPAPGTKG